MLEMMLAKYQNLNVGHIVRKIYNEEKKKHAMD